jgi:hypothetical protein
MAQLGHLRVARQLACPDLLLAEPVAILGGGCNTGRRRPRSPS